MQQFSCGHWATDIDDNGILVALKAHDVAQNDRCGFFRSIHYGNYCTECYNNADKMGHVLHTDEEEMAWIRGETI